MFGIEELEENNRHGVNALDTKNKYKVKIWIQIK